MTIYALSTPPGHGGIAVIRVSGPRAPDAARLLGVEQPLRPRCMHYATLRAPASNSPIDQAMVVHFPAPHSVTGEHLVEFHTHGSPAVLDEIFSIFAAASFLTPAEPGAFTKQAFMNGKMDLTEAEGLHDLIHAATHGQKQQALAQLGGALKRRYESWRNGLLESLALLEAYLDFPEEDIPAHVLAEVAASAARLRADMDGALDDGGVGEKIREGLTLVIVGPPNAGKSSLMNYLAERDVAIVSETEGTTRDALELSLNLGGYLVTLMDTAGLRETSDPVERLGIERAVQRAAQADLCLVLLDATRPDATLPAGALPANVPALTFYNKADLLPLPHAPGAISIATGEGMPALTAALTAAVAERLAHRRPPLITRERHRAALQRAAEALGRISPEQPLELMCEELRLATEAIGAVTGRITVDEILGEIFSRFCIGK